MDLKGFDKEQVVKVMLHFANNKRSLDRVEAKYYSSIQEVSEYRYQEIISFLERECCVEQHSIFIKNSFPSQMFFPF